MPPPTTPRPNEVAYVLYFVGHRATVDEFNASLPCHGGPNQAVMYSVKKQLASATAWFEWLRSTARPATHWWWEKLNEERNSFVANLAHLFLTWSLPLSPFIHALCRLAAEWTQTEPCASDDTECTDDESEEEARWAAVRPRHKLDFAYWPLLRKLLSELVGKMAETQAVQLWSTPGESKVMSVMDAPQDADWMAAIQHAARVQQLHGMSHMIDSLNQTVAIATRNLDHTLVMQVFTKRRHDADRRWSIAKKKPTGVLKPTRLPKKGTKRTIQDSEAEWLRKWEAKEMDAQLRAKSESQHLRLAVGQLLDDALAADPAVQSGALELPGDLGKPFKRARTAASTPSPHRQPPPSLVASAPPSSSLAVDAIPPADALHSQPQTVSVLRGPPGMSQAALVALVSSNPFAATMYGKEALEAYKRREEQREKQCAALARFAGSKRKRSSPSQVAAEEDHD